MLTTPSDASTDWLLTVEQMPPLLWQTSPEHEMPFDQQKPWWIFTGLQNGFHRN